MVSVSLPTASTMTSSSGFRPAMKRRAALLASVSFSPLMLKLRSSAMMTDSGNSPAKNVDTVCGAPSSAT